MDDKKSSNQSDAFDPSRRRFLKNTGMVVGGVAGGSLLGGFFADQFLGGAQEDQKKPAAKKEPTRARMFFTRFEDFVVLEQATELIFPKDDQGPGAIELDVPYFIDKQLAGIWGVNGNDYRQSPFQKDKKMASDDKVNHARENRGNVFLEGIRKMNTESKRRFKTSFDKADEKQKNEIMHDMEKGKISMKSVSSDGFFTLLKQATMEGAFSDPLYGGNKNMEGWKMKEFPGSQMSYASVIDKDEFVKMKPISLRDYQQNN